MTAHEVHLRYFRLMLAEGNDDQQARVRLAAAEMKEFHDAFPGSTWEPLDDVELPEGLRLRAKNVARVRHAQAKRFNLRNKHGVTRHLDDEVRAVEGELAGIIMVGAALDVLDFTPQRAKAVGNLGDNRSAFIPKQGNWQLVVRPEQPNHRRVVLIQREGDRFRCPGWCHAGEAKTAENEKTYVRGGVQGVYYLVPTGTLRPIGDLLT